MYVKEQTKPIRLVSETSAGSVSLAAIRRASHNCVFHIRNLRDAGLLGGSDSVRNRNTPELKPLPEISCLACGLKDGSPKNCILSMNTSL